MECDLILEVKKGAHDSQIILTKCLGFTFEKDLYMPYTKVSALFYGDGQPEFAASGVMSVELVLDGSRIHYGMPDKVSIERCAYGYRVRVTSRGYTLLLAQNEPYPRLNNKVTLKSLCTDNLDCDRISYEDPTPTVANIYVREGSTVWEAAVAYCIKASGRYPYIRGINSVRMSLPEDKYIDYTDCLASEMFEATDSSMILSDVYMQELDESYPFEAHDGWAADMGIVRSRYYPLDMQWLYEPQTGLQHKLDFSNRKVREYGLTYRGWKREDLMDLAYGGEIIDGMRINHIRIVGGKKGVFTTVKAYDDRYGQKK